MDDGSPETWADAQPLEEAEFTYSNMTSFLSGMGVGPFAQSGRNKNKGGMRHMGAERWEDPLGLDAQAEANASPKSRMRKRGKPHPSTVEHAQGTILSEDDFDAARFLSVRHQDASYEQLQSGLDSLTGTINDHKRLLKSLVLQHFDQFLRCKDSIDSLQEGLEGTGSDHVERVNELYDELEESGNKLYKPLLDAKRDTERTRSGLQVLRQYRFLFEIPATIHDNIEAKEYDKVVKEYRRAKLLVSRSERPVYQRVWQEVERIVMAFRSELLDTLTKEAELPWDRHKALVKCLAQLDCPVNPVGQLLLARQRCLQNLLDDAFQTLQARVDTAADREWERISMERTMLYDADAPASKLADDEDRAREAIRQSCTESLSVEYLQKVSAIVTERVPSLCDAATQLASLSVSAASPDGRRSSELSTAGRASTALSGAGPAGQELLGELLEDALRVYCARVTGVLGKDARWWKRDFVVALRGCRDRLRECSRRFDVPWTHFRTVAHLDDRVAIRYAEARWEAALHEVASIASTPCLSTAAGIVDAGHAQPLHSLPNAANDDSGMLAWGEGQHWDTVSVSERGMLDTIAAFEQAMRQAFKDLSAVYLNASTLKGSMPRLEKLGRASMFDACARFADCIHQIAFVELPKHAAPPTSAGDVPIIPRTDSFAGVGAGVSDNMADESPLLLLLRLLHHAIRHSVPALFDEAPVVVQSSIMDEEDDEPMDATDEYESPSTARLSMGASDSEPVATASRAALDSDNDSEDAEDLGRDAVLRLFTELHEMLLARHCREHSVVLRELVSGGISRAGVVWADWPRPFEVRGYVINILLHCVKIHADTIAVVPSELKRVLGAALEVICGVFREEVDLISDDLTLHSAEQLNLELNFITTTLQEYETTISAGRAKMCRSLLSKKRLAAIDAGGRQTQVDDSFADVRQIQDEAFLANEVMFSCFRSATPAAGGAERRPGDPRPSPAAVRGSAAKPAAAVRRMGAKVSATSAFSHPRPGRTSLVGRLPTTVEAPSELPPAAAAAAATTAQQNRRARLEAAGSGAGRKPRPRTPPSDAKPRGVAGRGLAGVTGAKRPPYESSRRNSHVRPQAPDVPSVKSPPKQGQGLTLSPASVAPSAQSAAKPRSPPKPAARSFGAAATAVGAARKASAGGKRRSRRFAGDV